MASSLTISGGVIDVNTIVSQLMSLEQRPISALSTKITTEQSKISAFGTLRSKVSAIRDAAGAMATNSQVGALSATASVSDPAAMTVNVTGSASVGTHTVSVSALAARQALTSQAYASKTADLGLTDALDIEQGTWSGNSFTATAGKTPLHIDLTGKSLQDVADEINKGNAGVSAAITYDAVAGYKLTLSSVNLGASNGFRIAAKDVNGNPSVAAGAQALAYDKSVAGQMNQSSSAADAAYSVNGTSYTSSTNLVSHGGLSFGLKAVTAAPATVTVVSDTTQLKDKLNAFVAAYNALDAYVDSVAPTGRNTTGTLKGEMSVMSVVTNLRKSISQGGGPAGLSSLTTLGVRFQKDGTLSLDQAAFNKAVAEDPQRVTQLLAGDGSGSKGIMQKIVEEANSMMATSGPIESRTSSLQNDVAAKTKKKTDLSNRLAATQTKLTIQYARLDATLSSMQGTLSSVKSMMSSLSASNNSSN